MALPVHPHELAAVACGCVAAGAGAVHFHVRNPEGRESLAADVAHTMSAVRSACRRTPVGISTGAWIEPDPASAGSDWSAAGTSHPTSPP